MRRCVILTSIVAALAGASAQAVINISLTTDATSLAPGQQTVVHILAQGTSAGIFSLAGSIAATGDAGVLQAVPGSFVWCSPLGGLASYGVPAVLGAPDSDGGWASFGSCQSQLPPDLTFAKAAPVEVASYLVQGTGIGSATLTFQSGEFGGFMIAESNVTQVPGTITEVTIQGTPEPGTLALVATAVTAFAIRRRR